MSSNNIIIGHLKFIEDDRTILIKGKPEPKKKAAAAPPPEPKIDYTAPKGLYIWGGCGSGKSFLMDLFYETQTHIARKRRVHFHEWMIEVIFRVA